MNDENLTATCDQHGVQPAAFVCDHLLQRTGGGFFIPDDTEEEKHQAWCESCEKIILNEGEWTQKAVDFANFRLVCVVCFKRIRAIGTLHILR